ncbi:hypothetical protein [Magnetovirga frankeli]|jgi:hypothetical protein|uniref:hypothetical protein n=1 Tax=Magnetovirga frankeli TaxID=947516 RepID=UPI003D33169B
MTVNQVPMSQTLEQAPAKPLPSLLAGAGLTLASLILLPALAQRVGMGPALTGALRAALMKASHKV